MSRIDEQLERIAAGIEKLAEDPVIQVESGPPVCPNCERINPDVRVAEKEGRGPLGDFVIEAECQHCFEVFYAVPQMWLCVKSVEEVRMELDDRRQRGNS